MKNWSVDNTNTPLVSINCITYNHEQYIEQALDGFIMQKTNFPFEIIIHDDASTDKTADIIRKYEINYPKIIKPIYETENQFSKDNYSFFNFISAACKGKYIAICEGDDYWTDEKKLQIQVNFLEQNPDFSASFHNVNIFQEKEQKLVSNYLFREVPDVLDVKELAKQFCIPTCSFIYRRNPTINTKIQKLGKMPFGDYSLELFNAENGKIKKFNNIMGVYRVGNGINTSTFNNPYSNFKRYLQDYMAMAKLYMALEDSDAKIEMQQHLEEDETIIMNYYTKAQTQAIEYQRVISVYSSISFKLGKFLTAPFRWMKRTIQKIVNQK